jgi:hypothetical protein
VFEAAAAKAAWLSQRRQYRDLRRRKCSDYWSHRIENDALHPQRLWKSVDALLGRGRSPASPAIDVERFRQFFEDKVAAIRSGTCCAPPPTFREVRQTAELGEFRAFSVDDVLTAINRLPDKTSAADPMPTSVLKQVADLIAPYLTELFNRSLSEGAFPTAYKEAFVTPVFKKPGLDAADPASYRPISNLPVVSKLFERLVVGQLTDYLNLHDLLLPLQSGFRQGHSTETAILRVLSDILQAVDRGDLAALVLLDLSAAFDTVDHEILLRRLAISYGITGSAHSWFRTYLSGRTYCIRRGTARSRVVDLTCGVPQGSVLGPILFILYTLDLIELVEDFGLSVHLYADDTQIYGSCRPTDVDALTALISRCSTAVAGWMSSNRLQLNSGKTEVLWCTSARRQHQLPTSPVAINGTPIEPVKSVRDLGIFIDADLGMRTHVQRTVSRCFFVLRQLRQIRRYVPASTFQALTVALVLSRLDYGNSVLAGLPRHLVRRLQSVLNAAARLVYGLRRADHVTDALVSLHWLRAQQRIDYKLATLTYRALSGTAPTYLRQFERVADLPGRRALRSANTNRLVVPSVSRSTIGGRCFTVAAATVWNSLPDNITSSSTLSAFRQRLKTHLFKQSYPHIPL